MKSLEMFFEKILYNCRLFALLAVLGMVVAGALVFLKGTWNVYLGVLAAIESILHPGHGGHQMILHFIAAVDKYLFGMVLLIFSMGVYELFVSRIDPADDGRANRPNWLKITSLDDLKTYLGKVVLMILIVNLFEQSFHLKYETPLDLLYLGGGVVLVALSLYLTHGHTKAHN